MSDWFFWVFSAIFWASFVSAVGYGFFRDSITDRDITWGLRFFWPTFYGTVAWLILLFLYSMSGLVGFHEVFGERQPWWYFAVLAIGGILLIGFAQWLGSFVKRAFRKKPEPDEYADPKNFGVGAR